MNFALDADHEALRDAAAAFLDKAVDLSPLLVPGGTVEQAGYETLWAGMVELGWPALSVPEAYDGLGMTYIDLAMIVGEMGRTLAPAPLFGTLAGAWTIEKAGTEAQKAVLLGAVAAGTLKLALAVADDGGRYTGSAREVVATADGGGHRLTGVASFVVDAAAADKLVCAASLGGTRRFFVVDKSAAGLSVEVLDWRDITRQVCTVRLDGTPAELLAGGSGEDVWPWVRDRLYFVLAAESAAGVHATLADAVDYAKQRVAFGKPIGAFQAIKHQLAEVAGLAEASTAAVHYAAWALTENDPRAPMAAAMAQSYASDAYKVAAHRNIQVFGAIGFTWQMKNHLYYKRARANAELLGSPAAQREEVVQMLEREAA